MPLYLPVDSSGGTVSIATCARCKFRVPYSILVRDPNTKQFLCPDCVDIYDPWRLPARQPENITLQHPFPDSQLQVEESEILGTEYNMALEFPDNIFIGITT